MVNGTLLNFGKIYEDDLRVIFDQWPKLHLGLDVLSNQKILNGVYSVDVLNSKKVCNQADYTVIQNSRSRLAIQKWSSYTQKNLLALG
jgi:hypothetical protein